MVVKTQGQYQQLVKLDHEVDVDVADKLLIQAHLYQLQDKLGHQVKEVEEVEVLGDMAEEQKEVPKK